MTVKPGVFVARRWPAVLEARLRQRCDVVLNRDDKSLSADEFRDALVRFDAVPPAVTDRLGSEALDVPKARTKILANYGVGFGHIDVPQAAEQGITIANTPDVLPECTADHLAMSLILMAARRAGHGEREVRAGQWTGWRPTHLVG